MVLVFGGCGGPSASFKDGLYRKGDVVFHVGSLDGWERVRVRGNDLAFYREDAAAIISVNGECTHAKDPPLRILAMQTLIGFTDRDIVLEETIPFDEREAMHMIVRAKLDGIPRTISLYVMKKNECLYDLTLVAPPERHPELVPQFDRFAIGFRAFGDGTR
jgi:hypothetical protein